MGREPEPVRDLDWSPEQARELGERVVGLWEEFLAGLRALPVSRAEKVSEVADAVTFEVPEEPMDFEALLEHLRDVVLGHSMYPGHPRFMAYITGAGTVPGAAADLVAAAINQNVGAWRLSPAASEIEMHLTRWFARQFGLPEGAGGIMVSGGAMAGFIALKIARDRRAGWDVREEGIAAGPPMVVYASDEVHSINLRAADMLGMGRGAVRLLPSDEAFRLDVGALRRAIEEDVAAGRRPIAVVGSGGTVATGAIDPLEEIADVCAEHDLWFHVDAAYGGPAVLAVDLRPRLAGIERADSIAFDPHKWLYTPHSGGCILVRDLQHLPDSFSIHATYVHEDKERTGTGVDGIELGPQFSRGFQALKVWISLLAHGKAAYARRIAHDAELARYLAERAEERPEFEPVAPVELSIACYRYVPPDLPEGPGREEYLDRLNERLMTELQLDGRVYPSNAVLRGRFVIRACIVNFRTEAEDIDALLDVSAELGAKLDADLRPGDLR
ncbi:MAG TPA: pyridoxal-dependent decarboxylase [Actinomycetota bacterium]|nr:pyridoxal-dependent decarboxylase [Actinomycetota bacterium]